MTIFARDVRQVLRGQGWVLRRQAAGGFLFTVSRIGGGAFCELSQEDSFGAGKPLTPASPLRARLLSRARLRTPEKAALKELRAVLGLFLESLRGGSSAGAPVPVRAESHEGSEGRDFLLRTTFACNQRCPFCFVPLTGRGADFAEIERELSVQARRAGPKGSLTISGGEPCADPRLLRIIAAARRRGFRRFVLQTNGVYLSRPGFLESLVRLGVRTYLFSFHSHKPGAYDRITASRGQYPRAVAGLTKVLRAKGCDVTVNVVVNARNDRDLPGLVEFLARLCTGLPRRRRPSVYFSMINEAGHQKAPSWAVSLERVAPYLRRAADQCREAGLPVGRSEGASSFPACLFSVPGRHASQRPLPQDRVRYAEDFSGEAGTIGRAKRPACRGCPYDAKCLGVPAQYARLFGLGGLAGHP
ncbi:MAG: radical SAM protein, partial [Elusimicrobiota bacterium]